MTYQLTTKELYCQDKYLMNKDNSVIKKVCQAFHSEAIRFRSILKAQTAADERHRSVFIT